MQFKEGAVVEGKVTGITKYGAFVKIDGVANVTGMIHISEISKDFVRDVGEHLKMNQQIRAVVAGVNENGRLALSIKKLNSAGEREEQRGGGGIQSAEKNPQHSQLKSPEEYVRPDKGARGSGSFEDMMSRFKQDSDEKMSGLKNFEPRKSNAGRRKTLQNNKSGFED